MIRKLYDKSRVWFAVAWIIIYCVLMSVGDLISAALGVEKLITLVVGIALSALILLFLRKNRLLQSYGICLPAVSGRAFLYYIPLVVMVSANLWFGFSFDHTVLEGTLFILSMLCVGFLEEIIFRGFLFEALRLQNLTFAVIISSLTFGLGHIINLINGSGAAFVPTLFQTVYAASAGFMFVMIYYRSKSLLVCIIAHGVFNALSVFAGETDVSDAAMMISSVLLTLITFTYGIYIALSPTGKREPKSEG